MMTSNGRTNSEAERASVLARVAALKTTPTPELKAQWRELFGTEPPPFNRRYIESRLAYRIQELAFGGLKPETKGGSGPWANSSTAATSRSGVLGSTAARSRAPGSCASGPGWSTA
jgi:Protein of unknown function (DUF2924)